MGDALRACPWLPYSAPSALRQKHGRAISGQNQVKFLIACPVLLRTKSTPTRQRLATLLLKLADRRLHLIQCDRRVSVHYWRNIDLGVIAHHFMS